MEFEFDEDKRLKNIEKHGIDFLAAKILFDDQHLRMPAKTVDGEQRWLAIGTIDDVYVTAVFAMRGSVIRIISTRRARNDERKKYQEVFGG
ncbi:MAG TPA: BrnT family toxin [Methylocella sp.]|nr:BrnT family toxin [Methylocella sp.]